MSKTRLSYGLGGVMAVLATLATPLARADSPHYRYVALEQLTLPAPYTSFNPTTVAGGKVFGTVFDDTFTFGAVAVYSHGVVTVGPAGIAVTADENEQIGGSSLAGQAAVFNHGATTLVPPLADETSASVISLGALGLSLVSSTNSAFATTYAYFFHGTETVINFGLPDPVFGATMNDVGFIAVTKQESASDHFLRGYRYNPITRTSKVLPPFQGDPTDTNVVVQGIDELGEVLGYSVTNLTSPAYHERVGVWDLAGIFHPYYEETINTSNLFFNDEKTIVITNSSDAHSYLVPQPGTRLDLASITSGVPAGLGLAQVVSIDNAGNIVGYAVDANSNFYPFLLVSTDDDAGGPGHGHHGVPWAIAHAMDRFRPRK